MPEQFQKPDECAGCAVEIAKANPGPGFWVQHGTVSERVERLEDVGAWLRAKHAEQEPA